MKKIIISIAAATVILFTSCSSSPSASSVAEKIDSHEPLTEADYATMTEYVIDGYRELGRIAKEAKTGKADTESVVTSLIELNNNLTYQEQFIDALNRYAADNHATKYPAIDEKLSEIATLRDEASVDIRSTSTLPLPADGSEPSATAIEGNK